MLTYMSAFLVSLLLSSVLSLLAMSGPVKKTKGKQKIEMKKIEREDDKLVTFSKRRSGIYKKASELVALCGVEIALLLFSPAGNPFSFGNPSVESVTNRFLNQSLPFNDNTDPLVEAHSKAKIKQLGLEFNEVVSQLASEKEKAKKLHQLIKGKETDQGWWEAPLEQLSQQELLDLYSKLGNFHNILVNKMNEKIAGAVHHGDGDEAISSLFAPMDPAQQTYPFPPGFGPGGQ